MKIAAIYITIILFILSLIYPAVAQDQLFQDLTDQAITLYQKKMFDQAIKKAREALLVAEKTYGLEHSNVAEALDNLSVYLQAEYKYEEAEKNYQRALGIIEKNFGPESEYLGIFLQYLSNFYKKIGKPEVAKQMEERASQIRLKANSKKSSP